MPVTFVKICGLRTVEQALAAVEAGADMLGFVFASSRRQVTVQQAAMIISAVAKQTQRSVQFTGLFVNEAPERIIALADELGLTQIQLSGDEDIAIWQCLAEAQRPFSVIKAVRLQGAPSEQAWLAPWFADASAVPLLVDAHVPGSYGGTGVVGDWERAAQLARQRPVMLAGGLTPENVELAIQQVRPWAVDVSSGVETNGVKDSAKIRAFLHAVHNADHTLRQP